MFFSDTAKLFLESIGRSQEVEHYLRRFRSEKGNYFALIIPDAECCRQNPDLLVLQLKSLARLGLKPAVLLSGISSDYSDPMKEALDRSLRESAGPEWESTSEVPVIHSTEKPIIAVIPEFIDQGVRRFHFLRSRGMIESDGIPLTVCAPDQEVDVPDQALGFIASALLSQFRDLHISVSSPANLLKEIFTVKGAGTLFRRPTVIQHMHSLTDEQKSRLMILIQESFGRALSDGDFLHRISDYYIEENYSGAALLEKTPAGMYLSKFAVGVDARGSGVAQDLWQRVLSETGSLFWRSRRTNSIHRWYEKIADGFQRLETWTVYWKGAEMHRLPELIEYAGSRPGDFVD